MTTTQHPTDVDAARREAARVPLEVPPTLFGRAMAWYSRRAYGDVLDTGLALLHNRKVLKAVMGFERRVAGWKALDADLKTLAQMASAAAIGCSWCVDFGWYAAHSEGLDVSRLEEVPRWRESDVFTPLERDVMEYAEAMTATPPEVTDELAGRLRDALGDEAFVELTMMVAVENERSRFNSALGLTSQGFKDRCELRR
ncbi:carboxymuconolactone decarboxylase family protein [Nocardioides caldifontis]|uniref:carboxymuconolactone decarboxylase family protein n=1 Tax=Nocardioides caldifontis TaxID=2588938 RepID=UPI0011DF4CDC|nr:carboxymuconolactone decarboxylase family protein [Nocardioides caldifontis]